MADAADPRDDSVRAGSTLDIVGRIVLDPLSSQLGQTIVVENRGGAGGTIGTAAVAKADPDGYTILINASAHSAAPRPIRTSPTIRRAISPRSFRSARVPNVTVIAPAKGIKTLQELVGRPPKRGSLTYASAGVGSATHWAAERLRVSAGFTGRPRPVPRRPGSADRGDDRARRLHLHGHVVRRCRFMRDGKLICRSQ